MSWDLIQKFNHMEKVVLGSRAVAVEEFCFPPVDKFFKNEKAFQCPFCKTYFYKTIKSKTTLQQIECPFCYRESEFVVQRIKKEEGKEK